MKNKTQIRSWLKQQRLNLTLDQRMSFDHIINQHLLNFILARNGIIGIYYPINEEVDILPVVERLVLENIPTALPCTVEEGYPLLYFPWQPKALLHKNKQFNTYEPLMDEEEVTPDIIIVPLLGFDKDKYRIGYGKGFYDLTLQHFSDAIAVGVGYEVQRIQEVPVEEHDQRLQFIITEAGIF